MALPNGPHARNIKPAREETLTVEQLLAELAELPGYYPTAVREVRLRTTEDGVRVDLIEAGKG